MNKSLVPRLTIVHHKKLGLGSCRHMRDSPIPQTDTPTGFSGHTKNALTHKTRSPRRRITNNRLASRTFSFTFLPVERKNRSSGETFNSTTSTDPGEGEEPAAKRRKGRPAKEKKTAASSPPPPGYSEAVNMPQPGGKAGSAAVDVSDGTKK